MPGYKDKRNAITAAWRRKNGMTERENRRLKWANDPDFARDYELKSKYGIRLTDVDTMLAAQNGLCLICDRDITGRTAARAKAVVDHCHATKKVRGLLCFRCNSSLGAFGDNPGTLDRAAAYLRKYAP